MNCMKKYVFILLLIWACTDKDPLPFNPKDALQVTGLWRQWPADKWVWHFDGNGLLTISVFDFGVEVWSEKRAYWTSGDTLRTMEFDSEARRVYLVEFENENTFWTSDTAHFGIKNRFTRL